MFLCGHIQGDFQTCISVLLMDLSNVFDTINHELTVAKLYAYGFSIEALQFYYVIYKVGHKESRSMQLSFPGTQLFQSVTM